MAYYRAVSRPFSATIDTITNATLLNPTGSTPGTYNFSEKGIAWPGEKKKYAPQPGYPLDQIVPPPNWARYRDGYTAENPPPNLREDEHFQNWMRTSGLPTFTKLYGRNDNEDMPKGTYEIVVFMSEHLFACGRKTYFD